MVAELRYRAYVVVVNFQNIERRCVVQKCLRQEREIVVRQNEVFQEETVVESITCDERHWTFDQELE